MTGRFQLWQGGTLIQATVNGTPVAFLVALLFTTPMLMFIVWEGISKMGATGLAFLCSFLLVPLFQFAFMRWGLNSSNALLLQVLEVFKRTTGAVEVKPEEIQTFSRESA